MTRTLYLEKRGCNFWHDDNINTVSDVGNYRICTPDECIKGKDGNTYFLEFTQYDKYTWRSTHKKTGKPLKHEVRELVLAHALHIDTQYSNDNGCWRNCKLEAEIHKTPVLFTLENILKVVNEVSIDTYGKIEFIN